MTLILGYMVVFSVHLTSNTIQIIPPARANYSQPDVLKDEDIAKIPIYSAKYGVSSYQIIRTIECESHFRNIQSKIVKGGVRENSWGIAQINLTMNPSVTREQALDIDFAIDFMASEFKAGRDWKWFGYDKSTDLCTWEYSIN